MANTGGGAAYQKLQVPKDGISQAMQHWGGIEASKLAAKKLADERAGVRKAAADQAISDKYQINPEDYDITDAGYDDENQANIALSREIIKKNTDMMRQGKALALAGKMDEAQEIYDSVKINESNFGNEQELSNTHKTNFDYLVENSDDLSGYAKGFENFYKAGSGLGKIIKTLNDKGEIIHMAEVVDDDGNRHKQVVSAKDIKNGNWRPYMKQDVQKDTTDIATSMSEIKRDGQDGYFTTETIQWDDGKDNGIHTEATRGLIQSKLGNVEYMSDMVDKFNLYDEFNIDENNPPVNHKFTKEQKKVVEDKLLDMVKAKYNETYGRKFMTGKYSADTRPKPTDKSKDPSLSRLNYDGDQFVSGDYTGLLGTHETEYGETINIREVIPAPNGNYVVAVTDTGEEIEIPNTKRGFLEFKIRNKPEYKGLTPEKVMDNQATQYRTGTIGGAEISAIAKGMFDEEGKPKFNDEKFLKKLKDNFDITGTDETTWSGNSLIINGKKVSTASQGAFEKSLKAALGNKKKLKW